MKTLKKLHAVKMGYLVCSISMLMVCCSSDDDEVTTTIQAQQQTFEIGNLNNCNTSIGTGTIIEFTIPYTASSGTNIEQLQVETRVSDGGSDFGINTLFTDDGNEIVWVSCFRYGSQTWVEYQVRLEASNGTLSNPTTVRVDRPAGAD